MNKPEVMPENLPFYLKDNFAPTFEEVTATELKVTGEIPRALNGRMLRNGPNPQTGWSSHWFLGDGMIHGVELEDGKANWYRNRYVRTPLFADSGADPIEAIMDLQKSAANTHIIHHAGKILALEEAHLPFALTPELETEGPWDFAGKLNTPMTAHPKTCPETGELLFFGYGIFPPYLTYHRVSASGELVQSEEITVPGATMIHDFNITRNYVIWMDLPAVWDVENMADSGLPIKWDPSYGARLGVMPREGCDADVVWYEIDPCYVFHPLNAYEEGNQIVIDVCRKANVMAARVESPAMLYRWVIDQDKGTVTETQLDDRSTEFPRLNDSLVGLKHRYGYVAGLSDVGPLAERYIKFDLANDSSQVFELGAGREGSEAVFVADPDGSAEDDGWLLSYVFDKAAGTSELVIMDAADLSRGALATVHLPARVPMGFHGSWIPENY
ncbi:carotenoid oxygenase family protein [Candidatus Litorirhabdus singularis]|nr:carotenoid oxygenase family protein [Candidatus Litorirhabdus singularis]